MSLSPWLLFASAVVALIVLALVAFWQWLALAVLFVVVYRVLSR